MEPDRSKSLLAATEKLIVPLPVPLAPEVIVRNAAVLLAVQLQAAGAVTVRVPVPPAAEKLWLLGLIDATQLVPLRKPETFG
jgi:hypothetical protein